VAPPPNANEGWPSEAKRVDEVSEIDPINRQENKTPTPRRRSVVQDEGNESSGEWEKVSPRQSGVEAGGQSAPVSGGSYIAWQPIV